MNWYIGQEIVCIDDKGSEGKLKEGHVYVIETLSKPCCQIVIGVGIKAETPNTTCSDCGVRYSSNEQWTWREKRFAPLDSLVNISELTEVLNEPAFK